jgi:uncharacterized membrane protein HdeD (DUF308 family)
MAFFDLRLPLGWLFVIFGALLLLAGLTAAPTCSDGRCLDLNINLVWGVVLLVFGFSCLAFAWNYARKRRQQQNS